MLLTVYVWGSGAISLILFVNSWASLHVEAPLQFTTGRIGCSGLCSLIKPLIEGADGLRLMYFHFSSGGDKCFAVVYDLPHRFERILWGWFWRSGSCWSV